MPRLNRSVSAHNVRLVPHWKLFVLCTVVGRTHASHGLRLEHETGTLKSHALSLSASSLFCPGQHTIFAQQRAVVLWPNGAPLPVPPFVSIQKTHSSCEPSFAYDREPKTLPSYCEMSPCFMSGYLEPLWRPR